MILCGNLMLVDKLSWILFVVVVCLDFSCSNFEVCNCCFLRMCWYFLIVVLFGLIIIFFVVLLMIIWVFVVIFCNIWLVLIIVGIFKVLVMIVVCLLSFLVFVINFSMDLGLSWVVLFGVRLWVSRIIGWVSLGRSFWFWLRSLVRRLFFMLMMLLVCCVM